MASNNVRSTVASAALKGAAVGIALIEAASLQARPAVPENVRTNALNTPVPTGDAYQTGRGLLSVGDVTSAMAAFRQALVDTPQSIDVLNALGVCYDRLGRYDLSRTYYDTALAIEPNAPLVLNNLGYSLYLQGQYQAAIPVLQSGTNSPDPAIAAASRRVLALVAARMRDSAARASHLEALADIGAATDPGTPGTRSARIETAANGEQRLVIGGPAPDRRLVASLGDDAALVIVAKPWTARDDRALADHQAAEDRADAAAGAQDLAALAAPAAPVLASLSLESAAAQPAAGRVVVAPRASLLARAEAGLAPAARIPAKTRERAASAQVGGHAEALAAADTVDIPAWLLSSRRIAKAAITAGTVSGQDPVNVVGAFDSDDNFLNAFAARMRSAVITDDSAQKDAALARLHALVARVRSA
ncbi:hypothetical protein GCM10011529_16920 [Polymorphobacter glacialis]|uniref:Tetratricopeptide repeat protein n=1 Tax=Sandarakinorhabdus glacialis TaxID=1614636 RepID=A0A916ZRY8_9SPHN|nr:tetratricopeptide repeat protein [Polymorphobacter glacialis]GGE11174.1 hypothetical protein GCM10011529_16920 [Polymorphobacter glacialis]